MNYIEQIQIIETLIGSKLSDASLIEPVDIREVMTNVTDFLKKISPLASGTFPLGNVSTDEIRFIELPYDVGTSDYRVVGSLVSKGSNFNNDNDIFEMVREKTTNSFKLCLREMSSAANNLDFDWAIYPKN